MSHTPLFSILIANYNNGKYLMEAVESVRQQTYINWEIILVDDASTDHSRELYNELEKDERIHIYFNEVNHGCGYTKHRCAELANGEICGFLDSDDALLPKALEQHIEVYHSYEDAAIVYSDCYLCDNDMNVVKEHRMQPIPKGETLFSTHQYIGPAHFASYKNACYKQTEGICYYPAGVDQDLYLKVEEKGQAYILDEFTYLWREVQGSVSRQNYWKSEYWNLIVLHDTCVRRGLNDSDYGVAFLEKIVNQDSDGRSIVACDAVRKSITYRVGYWILNPFRWLKTLVKK